MSSKILAALGGGASRSHKHAVLVPRFNENGELTGDFLTLYVRELGALEKLEIGAMARSAGWTGFSDCMAASICDDEDNRFTVEELMSLRDEAYKPLLAKFNEVNRANDAEDPEKN